MARQPQPIARRLIRVNLLVAGAALLLVGGALVTYDFFSFRQIIARTLGIQAEMIGTNSVSALVFDDPTAASATLGALSASPNVVAAGIFTPDGRLFAVYPDGASTGVPARPPQPPADRPHWFSGLQLELVHDVRLESRLIGHVYIRARLRDALPRMTGYVLVVLLVSCAALLAAVVVSRAAQRGISEPVAQLADVARQVSRDKNYAVRAPEKGQATELTVLATAFNEMLDRVERRDRELQTARDELEVRVRQRTAELDAANKELEAFSYSVSHDLRAPLRHMTGFAEMLRERAGPRVLDDEARRYLRTITAAATRMGRLIDDLLSFSRMGRTHLHRSHVRLSALVEDVRAEVSAAASGRDITWHIDAALPEVEADPAMLRVAFVNLLSNAVKYTSTRPSAEITVGSRPSENGTAVLYVRDNGVGFDPQYVHKLFGVFQRLHRSDEFEGTGIGLANVRRVIHRHGGEVWAEGKPDQGATFYVSLPTKGSIS